MPPHPSAPVQIGKTGACTNCHKRKIRCDLATRGSPCTGCLGKNLDQCQAHEKRFPSPNTISQTKPRIRRILRLRTEEPLPPISLTGPVQHLVTPYDATDSSKVEIPTSFLDQEAAQATIVGQSSRLVYIGSELSNCNYIVHQKPLPDDAKVLHSSAGQYNIRQTAFDLDFIPHDCFQRSNKLLEKELIDAYFTHVNCGWAIVDEQNFRAQWQQLNKEEPLSLLLLNAVLVVGAHVLLYENSGLKPHQVSFYRRAKLLFDSRCEQNRIIYIQSALLLSWYSDSVDDVIANGWFWIGVAARTATGAGVHRDASQVRLDIQYRTWVHVWWTLFQFDTLISLAYGRPQALYVDVMNKLYEDASRLTILSRHLDDCDVPDLEASHFSGIPNAQIDFIIQTTNMCILISQILRQQSVIRSNRRFSFSTQSTTDAWNIDTKLDEFIQNLPVSMQRPLSQHSTGTWQAILHLIYNTILLLLHRTPGSGSARSNEPISASRTSVLDTVQIPIVSAHNEESICEEATDLIVNLLASLDTNHRLQSLNSFGSHIVETAIIQVNCYAKPSDEAIQSRARQMSHTLVSILRKLSRSWSFASCAAQCIQHEADTTQEITASNEYASEDTDDIDLELLYSDIFGLDFEFFQDFHVRANN